MPDTNLSHTLRFAFRCCASELSDHAADALGGSMAFVRALFTPALNDFIDAAHDAGFGSALQPRYNLRFAWDNGIAFSVVLPSGVSYHDAADGQPFVCRDARYRDEFARAQPVFRELAERIAKLRALYSPLYSSVRRLVTLSRVAHLSPQAASVIVGFCNRFAGVRLARPLRATKASDAVALPVLERAVEVLSCFLLLPRPTEHHHLIAPMREVYPDAFVNMEWG